LKLLLAGKIYFEEILSLLNVHLERTAPRAIPWKEAISVLAAPIGRIVDAERALLFRIEIIITVFVVY
jgi:hypothetical protein